MDLKRVRIGLISTQSLRIMDTSLRDISPILDSSPTGFHAGYTVMVYMYTERIE